MRAAPALVTYAEDDLVVGEVRGRQFEAHVVLHAYTAPSTSDCGRSCPAHKGQKSDRQIGTRNGRLLLPTSVEPVITGLTGDNKAFVILGRRIVFGEACGCRGKTMSPGIFRSIAFPCRVLVAYSRIAVTTGIR